MGGVETFIYNTTTNMDKSKYDFYYMVHGSNDCVFEKEINNYYKNEKHIYYFESFKKHPISCFCKLYKFYKKYGHEFDFVHLETGTCSEVVYVFPFNFLFKFKVITHSHNGNGYSKVFNNIFKPIVNIISYKKLSCSLEASKWLFGNKNINNVTIINNGIDNNRFKFSKKSRNKIRKELNIKDNDFLIGHIGRFSLQKNHEKIIDIFKCILRKKSNSYLALIGVGEKEQEIRDLVLKDSLLKKHVLFLDKRMNTEEYYSAFDCFLMPSLYEGLPIVGIEAQCSGLTCFFSDTIDHKILITDKSTLVSLDENSESWATKIINNTKTNYDRSIYSDIIDKAGYSQNNTLSALEEVYK